ncbi:MAG: zinc ribbon domain-containing protein [Thermoplasmata archaeon]|nr:zinc ribbon domain-containing protein [Thermoplasmata archaeon]
MGLVFLLMVVSLFAVTGSGASSTPLAVPHASPVTPAAAPAATTHGDLIVGPSNSPYVIAPGSSTEQTYYQAGNVTVQPGGKLIILQTRFEFVQYIGATGTIGNKLSHIYTFDDQGSVWIQSSTLTSDLNLLNPYAKVTVNVTEPGQLYVNSSYLEFAGSLSVYGAGAGAWVNGSVIAPNPDNTALTNGTAQTNDSLYAPVLSVTGGGRMTLAHTSETSTYKDNWTLSGSIQPNSLADTSAGAISSTNSYTFGAYTTPGDPTSLLQDTLYHQVSSGSVTIDYAATVDETGTGNTFVYTSSSNLPNIDYAAAGTQVTVALPASAIAQINALGVPAYFAAASAGGSSVTLGETNSVTTVSISLVQINLLAAASFNVTASGAGSTLTAVDTSVDVNWYPVAPFLLPPTAPPGILPWVSNKVVLTDGATGYLANLTTTVAPNPQNVTDISAVLPDATSQAYFYRWMEIPVYGAGQQPVAGGTAVASYEYSSLQSNNATANALNNLGSADPDLAAYVATVDTANHVTGYGGTNPSTGEAMLLLATGALDQGSLQDGTYLGDYHVVVSVTGGRAGPPESFNGSVAPYPTDMAPAAPDVQSPTIFPLYRPSLGVGVSEVTVGATNATANSNDTLAIGESTNFTVTVTNTGTGAVGTFVVDLQTSPPATINATQIANYTATAPLAVGASLNLTFPWVVNESQTGIPNPPIHMGFLAIVIWNQGASPIGGVAESSVNETIVPSYISLQFVAPAGALLPGNSYVGTATLLFSGNQSAWLNVTATSSAGVYTLTTSQLRSGAGITVELALPSSMANGQYAIQVTAYHQGRTAFLNLTSRFTVGPPPSGPAPWYDQKVLGLIPLWLLLVIIIAAVAAIVLVLLVFQRQAKGKLVECGECGNLIPEDATTCPKCGAEFEADLVRCSRCGSTIPANSQVCPECAAQLLGKGEQETSDPERQAYADFVERFRAGARKELGDNYNEGAFWDWWKRQSTYLPFSQWKFQQTQGSRAGMTAPPSESGDNMAVAAEQAPTPATPPKKGGGSGGLTSAPAASPPPAKVATSRAPAPAAPPAAPLTAPAAPPSTAAASPAAPMKACSNCGKEIPPEYLVCPFCGAVTQ